VMCLMSNQSSRFNQGSSSRPVPADTRAWTRGVRRIPSPAPTLCKLPVFRNYVSTWQCRDHQSLYGWHCENRQTYGGIRLGDSLVEPYLGPESFTKSDRSVARNDNLEPERRTPGRLGRTYGHIIKCPKVRAG